MLFRDIVLDIETVATDDQQVRKVILEGIEPARNLKDPTKIKADIEKKRIAALDQFGLSPTTGRVVCVCLASFRSGTIESIYLGSLYREETELLNTLNESIRDLQVEADRSGEVLRFVTFNGKNFDLPFLQYRMMAQGRNCPWIPRKNSSRNLDMLEVIRGTTYHTSPFPGAYKMSTVALSLGLKPSKGEGSEIQGLWDAGNIDAIVEHCKSDVEVLTQIFQRYTQCIENPHKEMIHELL